MKQQPQIRPGFELYEAANFIELRQAPELQIVQVAQGFAGPFRLRQLFQHSHRPPRRATDHLRTEAAEQAPDNRSLLRPLDEFLHVGG